MRLLVYGMLVNGIYYAHVFEQARWARSAGNSTIENLCFIIFYYGIVVGDIAQSFNCIKQV